MLSRMNMQKVDTHTKTPAFNATRPLDPGKRGEKPDIPEKGISYCGIGNSCEH